MAKFVKKNCSSIIDATDGHIDFDIICSNYDYQKMKALLMLASSESKIYHNLSAKKLGSEEKDRERHTSTTWSCFDYDFNSYCSITMDKEEKIYYDEHLVFVVPDKYPKIKEGFYEHRVLENACECCNKEIYNIYDDSISFANQWIGGGQDDEYWYMLPLINFSDECSYHELSYIAYHSDIETAEAVLPGTIRREVKLTISNEHLIDYISDDSIRTFLKSALEKH